MDKLLKLKDFIALKLLGGEVLSVFNAIRGKDHEKPSGPDAKIDTRSLSDITEDTAEESGSDNSGYGSFLYIPGSGSQLAEQSTTSTSQTTSTTNYTDRLQFVLDMRAAYLQAGVTNPDLVDILVSLDAAESGWGSKPVGNFNYSNIKSFGWNGASVTAKDNVTGSVDGYRSYGNLPEYIEDKLRLLNTSYDITNNDTAESAISKLNGLNHTGKKWAENPNYGLLLTNVYRSISTIKQYV